MKDSDSKITMISSIELASLINRPHTALIKDMKLMIEELQDDPFIKNTQYLIVSDAKRYISEIKLDKELCRILMHDYSLDLRDDIIRYWFELENKYVYFKDAYFKIAKVPKEIPELEKELEYAKLVKEYYLTIAKLETLKKQILKYNS